MDDVNYVQLCEEVDEEFMEEKRRLESLGRTDFCLC